MKSKQELEREREVERQARLKVRLDPSHTYAEGYVADVEVGSQILANYSHPSTSIKQVLTSHSGWSSATVVYEIESRVVAIRDAKTLNLISEVPTNTTRSTVEEPRESWEEKSV